MEKLLSTREVVSNVKGKVLGGAKVPHQCSMPVLRMVDQKLYLAFYVQFYNREQIQKQLLQRPSYWYLADIENGTLVKGMNCRAEDFCTAPKDRLYQKGTAARPGTQEDISQLYEWMDQIRQRYLKDGIIDAFLYRDYLNLLFEILPKGQINFYKELSRLK